MELSEFRAINIERNEMRWSGQVIFICELSELETIENDFFQSSMFNMSEGKQYAVLEHSELGVRILSSAKNDNKFTLDKSQFTLHPNGIQYHDDISFPPKQNIHRKQQSRRGHPSFIHKQYQTGTFNREELGLLSVLLDRGKIDCPTGLQLLVGETHDDMSVDLYFHLPYYKYVLDKVVTYWTEGAYANSNSEQEWIDFSKKIVYLNYNDDVETANLRPHFYTVST